MNFTVRLTSAACRDLMEIYDWIAEHDSQKKADYVLDKLNEAAESVAALPHCGTRVNELPPGTEAEYGQVYFKSYRVVYEIMRNEVVIHLIADGRRNLQSLLMRRLSGQNL
jgi:toxin ParE1/3/4